MTIDKKKCPLCKLSDGVSVDHFTEVFDFRIKCPRCFTFIASSEILEGHDDIDEKIKQNKWALSGLTRLYSEDRKSERPIKIANENLDELINNPLVPRKNDIDAKATKLLEAIKRRTKYFGSTVDIQWEKDYPLAFAENDKELRELITLLLEQDLIKEVSKYGDRIVIKLSAEGMNFIKENVLQDQVFLAAWFDKKRDKENQLTETCIMKNGFSPMYIKEKAYPETVMEKAFGEIKKSRLVIADLTGFRKSVFVEIGYALALDKPVFFLHDKTSSKEEKKEFEFYTKQFPIKSYDNKNIEGIIESILGLF